MQKLNKTHFVALAFAAALVLSTPSSAATIVVLDTPSGNIDAAEESGARDDNLDTFGNVSVTNNTYNGLSRRDGFAYVLSQAVGAVDIYLSDGTRDDSVNAAGSVVVTAGTYEGISVVGNAVLVLDTQSGNVDVWDATTGLRDDSLHAAGSISVTANTYNDISYDADTNALLVWALGPNGSGIVDVWDVSTGLRDDSLHSLGDSTIAFGNGAAYQGFSAVPEPGTVLLLGSGFFGLALLGRKRN